MLTTLKPYDDRKLSLTRVPYESGRLLAIRNRQEVSDSMSVFERRFNQSTALRIFFDRDLDTIPESCLDAVYRDRSRGEKVYTSLRDEEFDDAYRDEYGMRPGMLIYYYGVGGSLIKNTLGEDSRLGKFLTAANPISHWGIYIGRGHIMEIGPPRNLTDGRALEICTKMDGRSSKRGTRLVTVEDWLDWGNGAIYWKTYKNGTMFDNRHIVERALWIMNDIAYSIKGDYGWGIVDPDTKKLIEGNCEMIANYVATGIAESLQVTRLVDLVKSLGRTIALSVPFFLMTKSIAKKSKNVQVTGGSDAKTFVMDITNRGCVCSDRCEGGSLIRKPTCRVLDPATCGSLERDTCQKRKRAIVKKLPDGKVKIKRVLTN